MNVWEYARTDHAILRCAQDKLPRLFAELVGAVGRWLHFAGHFGRGRCAEAFADITLYPMITRKVNMHTITITLPDDRMLKLKETATQLQVSPEELVRVSIEELLTRPQESFQRALDVLKKNAELYRRLA